MTHLFAVDGPTATAPTHVSLTELGLHERAHLQEWVISHPEVLGEDVLVVTAEFDRWGGADGARARDRLDVLGLESSGRLVVVELKREDSGGDVHLQAITYAALVSRFTLDTLAEAHHAFQRRRGVDISLAEARQKLIDYAAELDTEVLRRPRIVLIAGAFPRQVTHTAVWLSEMGLDVDLLQVSAWRTGDLTLAGFTKLYPTPEVEEFTLAPLRAESGEAARRVEDRRRAASTTRRIVATGLLADGALLHLVPSHGTTAETRQAIEEWVAQAPERGRATWRTDQTAPLVWKGDDQPWQPTTLAKHILREAAGVEVTAVRGPQWWVTEDDVDLSALADRAGAVGGPFDWSALHRLMPRIPRGRWTTYGDVATVVGTAGQPLGGHVTKCATCTNAWRLLSAEGKTSPGFRWTDGRPDTPMEVLQEEGVRFFRDAADPSQRLTVAELRQLLTATGDRSNEVGAELRQSAVDTRASVGPRTAGEVKQR